MNFHEMHDAMERDQPGKMKDVGPHLNVIHAIDENEDNRTLLLPILSRVETALRTIQGHKNSPDASDVAIKELNEIKEEIRRTMHSMRPLFPTFGSIRSGSVNRR